MFASEYPDGPNGASLGALAAHPRLHFFCVCGYLAPVWQCLVACRSKAKKGLSTAEHDAVLIVRDRSGATTHAALIGRPETRLPASARSTWWRTGDERSGLVHPDVDDGGYPPRT
jgi:hypothetical protein